MKHDGRQYDVELSVGKGQRLREPCLKSDLNAGLSSLLLSSGNHFRRGIDAINGAGCSDPPLSRNGKSSGTAAHVQNRLAHLKVCQAKHRLTEGALSPERH